MREQEQKVVPPEKRRWQDFMPYLIFGAIIFLLLFGCMWFFPNL